MAGKVSRAVSQSEYEQIIAVLRSGFVYNGHHYRPSEATAGALILETNLGIRISDIVQMRTNSIILENGRYRLDITEQKTGKRRTFTVPAEVYIYIQDYIISNNIKPNQKLFPVAKRTIQYHLKAACDYLGIEGVGTHSFRRFFIQEIYKDTLNIELCRILLQHSSSAITQRYIGISTREIETALQNHINLPAG